MSSVEVHNTIFRHPFSCIVSGTSQSGKTVFMSKFIQQVDEMVTPKIKEIIISYTEDQDVYHDLVRMDNRVKLVQGNNFEMHGDHTLVCLDDQMNECLNDKKIQDLFTKGVHHRSISVLLIAQDLYPQEKFARTIRRNSTYLVVLRSPTFASQVIHLGRQLFPKKPKFLISAYEQATAHPYSYIFINLHPSCPDELRVSSGILSKEEHVIFSME
jgi:hypothetical protein